MIDVPELVSNVAQEVSTAKILPIKRSSLAISSTTLILLSVVRNERTRLPDFYDHYRRMGVKRFVILDNSSNDGTLEFSASQPDTDVYSVEDCFHWVKKQGWINKTILSYGLSRWYIYADADELLVYDQFPSRSIDELVHVAERLGITRVRGFLIDMYAPGSLRDYRAHPGEAISATYRLFDKNSYREQRRKRLISRRGGPRKRCFGPRIDKFDPQLTKYPLFRLEPGELMVSPHYIFPFDRNFLSDCFIALLHYKFTPDFISKVQGAVESKSYWKESWEYRVYAEALERQPLLSLEYEDSATYSSPEDFIAERLITPIQWS